MPLTQRPNIADVLSGVANWGAEAYPAYKQQSIENEMRRADDTRQDQYLGLAQDRFGLERDRYERELEANQIPDVEAGGIKAGIMAKVQGILDQQMAVRERQEFEARRVIEDQRYDDEVKATREHRERMQEIALKNATANLTRAETAQDKADQPKSIPYGTQKGLASDWRDTEIDRLAMDIHTELQQRNPDAYRDVAGDLGNDPITLGAALGQEDFSRDDEPWYWFNTEGAYPGMDVARKKLDTLTQRYNMPLMNIMSQMQGGQQTSANQPTPAGVAAEDARIEELLGLKASGE